MSAEVLPPGRKVRASLWHTAESNHWSHMADEKSFWRAFLDWFVLFSGISTASNLSRTRKAPVVGQGLFLFRKPEKNAPVTPERH
jgi:hypothetical protein